MREEIEALTVFGSELWSGLKDILTNYSWIRETAVFGRYRNEADYTAPASSGLDFFIPGNDDLEYGNEALDTGALSDLYEGVKSFLKKVHKKAWQDSAMFKENNKKLEALRTAWRPDATRKKLDSDSLNDQRRAFSPDPDPLMPVDRKAFEYYYKTKTGEILRAYKQYIDEIFDDPSYADELKDIQTRPDVAKVEQEMFEKIDSMQVRLDNYDEAKIALTAIQGERDGLVVEHQNWQQGTLSTPAMEAANRYSRKATSAPRCSALAMAQTVLPPRRRQLWRSRRRFLHRNRTSYRGSAA